MRLFGCLIWYEESPTWLAACVASLAKIGVDHLVAVDGAYIHFPEAEPRSGVEQGEAISLTAHQLGIGTTIVRPQSVCWTEPEKRAVSFRHVEALASVFEDWMIVIDADEVIREGSASVKKELAAIPGDTHCAAARLFESVDPFAEPGTKNVSEKTSEIYQKFELPNYFRQQQSRFFRVMRDMDCGPTHYAYTGVDAGGLRCSIRTDLDNKWNTEGLLETSVAMLDQPPVIEHRDPHRTRFRKNRKAEYYALRDELGLEAHS
jgi:hypothetical protein